MAALAPMKSGVKGDTDVEGILVSDIDLGTNAIGAKADTDATVDITVAHFIKRHILDDAVFLLLGDILYAYTVCFMCYVLCVYVL
jgi:hypothetical protein